MKTKTKKPKLGRPLMGKVPRKAISVSIADDTHNYLTVQSKRQSLSPGHIVDQMFNSFSK